MQTAMGAAPNLGLDSSGVRLQPYTAEWPRLYAAEEARLRVAIGPLISDIQHVGSTSIPGMAAKPILDIAVEVPEFEEAAVCVAPLEALGYRYRGENGIPRRHYFVMGDPVTHHLHMMEAHSVQWADTIRFRDHLRHDASAAAAYAQLKRCLAEQFVHNRAAYQNGKSEFIQQVLRAPDH